MEGPFAVVNGVGDAATGAVKDIGTGITGVLGKINANITSALDKPPILGKYGPHKAVDRFVKGGLSSLDTAGNGFVASIQGEGHTLVGTAETPIDQLTGGMKHR